MFFLRSSFSLLSQTFIQLVFGTSVCKKITFRPPVLRRTVFDLSDYVILLLWRVHKSVDCTLNIRDSVIKVIWVEYLLLLLNIHCIYVILTSVFL